MNILVDPTIHMWFGLFITVAAVVSFMREKVSIEITSLAVLTALLVFGQVFPLPDAAGKNQIDSTALLSGFANPSLIAVLALLVMGQSISVVVFIGLIVLAGVVVNNAIVLVDTINRRRAEGLSAEAAVRESGRLRLRPILITTATTVLGLLPLSLGLGAGSEIQQPLAITVIGGLTSSTLLTLVVIPVVYSLMAALLAGRPAEAPDGAAELT